MTKVNDIARWRGTAGGMERTDVGFWAWVLIDIYDNTTVVRL